MTKMKILNTSAGGRSALTGREGQRLSAYRDSVGVLTIGVGHTGRMSPPMVTAGMRISPEQSDAFLAADLAPVEAALNKALSVPVSQNEFDALVSLLFNVGIGFAKPSMTIIARLNTGDVRGAAAGFDLFHRPPEIIGRRNSEKSQFLRPDPTTPMINVVRAEVLTDKAIETKQKAKDIQVSGAGAVAGVGVVTVVATQVHDSPLAHSHNVLWWGGGIAIAAGVVAGVLALRARSQSRSLSINAAEQIVAAHAAAPKE